MGKVKLIFRVMQGKRIGGVVRVLMNGKNLSSKCGKI